MQPSQPCNIISSFSLASLWEYSPSNLTPSLHWMISCWVLVSIILALRFTNNLRGNVLETMDWICGFLNHNGGEKIIGWFILVLVVMTKYYIDEWFCLTNLTHRWSYSKDWRFKGTEAIYSARLVVSYAPSMFHVSCFMFYGSCFMFGVERISHFYLVNY
jgi:hypothetical protein